MSAVAGSIPIAHLFGVVARRWRRWLIVVLATTLAGLLAALVIPRRYEAEVVALPGGNDHNGLLNSIGGDFSGLAALAGIGGENGQRAEAIEMLQSKVLAREFIQDAKL